MVPTCGNFAKQLLTNFFWYHLIRLRKGTKCLIGSKNITDLRLNRMLESHQSGRPGGFHRGQSLAEERWQGLINVTTIYRVTAINQATVSRFENNNVNNRKRSLPLWTLYSSSWIWILHNKHVSKFSGMLEIDVLQGYKKDDRIWVCRRRDSRL